MQIPRITAPHGVINPDAGVAATRPDIAPEHQPTIDHFLARRKSRKTQVAAANIATRLVFQQAMTALRFAPKLEPPLKPSQPNHKKVVPSTIKETL